MSVRDEGKTHFFGDDCPGGHRAANVAGVDWDDQETADEANAREAAERDSAALVPVDVTDEMVDAYVRAIFTGWYIEMKGEELRQDVRAGLAAVVPLIRAQVAAEHDAPAPIDGLRPKVSQALAATARVDLIWVDPPRVEPRPPVITPAVPGTFAAPVTFAEPDEPVAEVQAAFEAGEKGVTRRPAAEGQERSEEKPGPGEATTCPTCGRAIGVSRHGRLASHYKPGTLARCEGEDRG